MLELRPDDALDMTPAELSAYSEGYAARKKVDLDNSLYLVALQTCWILNTLLQLDKEQAITVAKLLNKESSVKTTSKEDYRKMVRQMQGGEELCK